MSSTVGLSPIIRSRILQDPNPESKILQDPKNRAKKNIRPRFKKRRSKKCQKAINPKYASKNCNEKISEDNQKNVQIFQQIF